LCGVVFVISSDKLAPLVSSILIFQIMFLTSVILLLSLALFVYSPKKENAIITSIASIIITTISSTKLKAEFFDLTLNPSPRNLTPNPSPFGGEGKEFKVFLHFD
jgi:hypothetical protein